LNTFTCELCECLALVLLLALNYEINEVAATLHDVDASNTIGVIVLSKKYFGYTIDIIQKKGA